MFSGIDDAPCRDRGHEQNRKHDYRRKRLLVIGAPLPNSAGLRRLRRCRFPIRRIIRKLGLDLFLLFLVQHSPNSAFTQPPSDTDRMPKSYSHLASSKTHSKRNATAGHNKRPITCKGGANALRQTTIMGNTAKGTSNYRTNTFEKRSPILLEAKPTTTTPASFFPFTLLLRSRSGRLSLLANR